MADQEDRLTAPWQQQADDQQLAHGHLALAIMYDELERPDDAVRQYQAARDLLAKLAAQDPTATQYQVALADCYRHLARLQLVNDRDGASQELEQGRTINRQLAAKSSDPRLRAGWLEAELESATTRGAEGGTENLSRVAQISDDFARRLPKDPVGLYELACYLGGREPILTTRKSQIDAK